jgi:predicted nucleic acid-binding protein
MDKILIDTNVILDFFFDRKPFSENASKILSLCEKKKLKGFVTPVMISNVYYLLRKAAGHKRVIESLKQLLSIVDVAIINKATVLEALNSNFKDFEDALQNLSAPNEKEIKIIITRNTKDYTTGSLPIMTPEAYLKAIEA